MSIRQSGAGQVHAEEVDLTQGGIVLAQPGEVEVTAGTIGAARASESSSRPEAL